MEFITKSAKETQKIAADLVEKLLNKKREGALVLGLRGELGAGKTTFVQGLAKALGIKEKVLSPTFVIMKHFNIQTPRQARGISIDNFYHIDCYRIEDPKELLALDLGEIIKDRKNLAVIEWAEKIKSILPEDTLWVEFEHRGDDERKIRMTNDEWRMTNDK